MLTDSVVGRWLTPTKDPGAIAAGVSTDTRTIEQGNLFVALKGPNYDAHDHLDEAIVKGASCLIVSRETEIPKGIAAYLVADTRLALGELASAYRQSLAHTTVIAITGSNGKTTTTRLVEAVLKQAGDRKSVV